MKTFTCVIALLTFLAVSATAQQVATGQMTLSFRSLTVSADNITFDSESGRGRASGHVQVQVDGHLKLSTDDIFLKIERSTSLPSVDGETRGHVLATIRNEDGTMRDLDTSGFEFSIRL